MIKVGAFDVIEFFSLMVPTGDPASLTFDFQGTTYAVALRFVSGDGQQELSMIPMGGRGFEITLKNWLNPLGAVLNAPLKLADLAGGGSIYVQVSSYAIGTLNKIDLQFMSESA